MLNRLTFDTEPIVGYFAGEASAKQVVDLLERIQTADYEGFINIFNLTEIYYTIARHDPKAVEEAVGILRFYGLKVIPVEDNGLWRQAALIKNKYHLSLGDCFAVATAQAYKSKLVVANDKELSKLNIPLIKIR